MRKPTRDVLRDAGGFTLIEMLVAMTMGVFVVAGAVMVFNAGVHSQPQINTESKAITTARTAMERMVRELRQASNVVTGTTPSSTSISVVTYVHSNCAGVPSATASQCSVTYSCSGGTCTRRVAQPNGTSPGAAVRVVSGLSSNNVFSCSPSCTAPTYIGVTLAFPTSTGANAITLTDGAAFRNPPVGS
jgi:prepilin-type N-terminal cleavage/methylation domain-containing protein